MTIYFRTTLALALIVTSGDAAASESPGVIYLINSAGPVEPYRNLGRQDAETDARSGIFRFFDFDSGFIPPPTPKEAKTKKRAIEALQKDHKVRFEILTSSKCWCRFRETGSAYGSSYNAQMLKEVRTRFGDKVARKVEHAGY